MRFKRILAAILTFGLSEIMGDYTPNDGVTMIGIDELRRAMSEGKVTFTKL